GVHHDWPSPRDRLANRSPGYEEEPDRRRVGADGHDVAVGERHEVAIADFPLLGEHAPPLEHVREHGVVARRAVRERLAGGNGHVEILRLRDDISYWPLDLIDTTRD